MSEYLVRKGKLFYEMAKFEDYNEPTALYLFTKRGCSCPSRRRPCKHAKILDAWKAAGETPGAIYSEDAKLIGNLFV
jgi:hypothetical protein